MDPYTGDTPPWDIGRPQPRLVQACQEGYIQGKVLDIACGTGENALYFASQAYDSWGIDLAPTGVEMAKTKAKNRELTDKTNFICGSALELEQLNTQFDTVTDSGFLHGRDKDVKKQVLSTVSRVLKSGGNYVILGFHEDVPEGRGPPNRLHQNDFDELFSDGWRKQVLEESEFHSNLPTSPHKAYFAVYNKS